MSYIQSAPSILLFNDEDLKVRKIILDMSNKILQRLQNRKEITLDTTSIQVSYDTICDSCNENDSPTMIGEGGHTCLLCANYVSDAINTKLMCRQPSNINVVDVYGIIKS